MTSRSNARSTQVEPHNATAIGQESPDSALAPFHPDALVFNFAAVLPGRVGSRHTERAYFRWVDAYLVITAKLKPTAGKARLHRMSALPIPMLQTVLTASQLRAWLGQLVRAGHGKQGINQARAAVVTLASLLAEAGWLDDYHSASISNVRPPKAEEGQRVGRWLTTAQLHLLMNGARQIATSETQLLRNQVLITMLCTMALRREELSMVKWGDISLQNDRVVLRVHGKGRKAEFVDMPRPVVNAVQQWRRAAAVDGLDLPPGSPLLRRIWKGGRVSKLGLSPDGIWLIVAQAAQAAGIDHVAPHDLRRSVAGALQQSGVSIDKISRLLRHSNVAVTERYLNKLPQQNEGAVLMSDLLGLESNGLWDE
ncbi:MAG: site-specific integrase [bacterium]|nr:site-specific integrase [bacterium]